jgi:hypothetical protein
MKLKHQLGGRRGVEYSITGNAQRLNLNVKKNSLKGWDGMIPNLSPNDPSFYMVIGEGNGKMAKDGSQGIKPGTESWLTYADAMILKQLMLDEELDLMWAKGGVIQGARGKSQIIGEGLYEQMKKGNWAKLPRYSRQGLMNVFGQVFRNRPDIADVDRHLHFQCGRGAVVELTRICTEAGIQITNALGTVLVNNETLKIIKGDAYNLEAGFRFGKVFLAGFGHLSFEHNPALDSEFSRTMDEPRVGGISKFSYTSMIMDVTETSSTNAYTPSKDVEFATGFDNKANIYLVRNQGMPGVKTTYVNGRTSQHSVSVGKGSVASSLFDGYTTFLEDQSSIWLRDPGRSVLITLA